ncbi:hypothetical protein GCM10007928_28950 [Sulfitobacter porphyrae]|nr:hypothetical protein GCM10007928_28950 [Sulfitobacter porphyrae]
MSIASDIEAYMLTLINEVRAEHGLGALTLEMNLNQSADDHSDWMIRTDTFSHTGVGDSTSNDRIRTAGFDLSGAWRTGENLAVQTIRGPDGLWDDVRNLHEGLMNSASHRANILNASYTHIGIGIDVGPMSYGTGTFYNSIVVTQNFGATQGALDEQIMGDARANVIETSFGEDYITGGAGNDLISTGSGRDTIDGGGGNDSVRAGDGADFVRGGIGADDLHGNAGSDTILGDTGNDAILGGNGNDLLRGGAQEDSIAGGEGNDRIFGEGGFDLLRGGTGNDTIDGGDQADNLYGDGGDDLLLGGAGFDRLFGGDGNDMLLGGDTGDALFGQLGNDTLRGEDGDDRFFGGQGNDLIEGGNGNDAMRGGAGFDRLDGGAGNDVLVGLFNADTFVFVDMAGGFGNDTINDFDATNPLERIDLSAVHAITDFNDLITHHVQQIGRSVLIDAGDNSSILLLGVSLGDLDGTDFIF